MPERSSADIIAFEQEPLRDPGTALRLRLEGYEGPLELLLDLARDQKVDLAQISILELAEQYLEFVRNARQLSLELAADYLVMAAWLAYLKSKLLLPRPGKEEEASGAEMAAALRYHLQRLEAMQGAARRLFERPQLGESVFPRGAPEPLSIVQDTIYEASLFELLRAYAQHKTRVEATSLAIQPLNLYSVDEAVERLGRYLGRMPEWRTLASFLPEDLKDPLSRRSAMASHFSATLELAKSGRLEIRQDRQYGPMYLRSPAGAGDGGDRNVE